MGCYTWLNEDEFEIYSQVSNQALNELFQEVRKIFPYYYISEHIYI